MNYYGLYPQFRISVRTLSLHDRRSLVSVDSMLQPDNVTAMTFPSLAPVVRAVLDARARGCPVIVFTGAHLIKSGLSLLLIDLMRRGLVSLVATTGAGMTHDFELAFAGATSEDVVESLPKGQFGMARETALYMNRAFRAAIDRGIGAGEALGRLVLGEALPEVITCARPDVSIAAAGITYRVPVTMHASIGTDVIDQHSSFDPEAKGGASGFDFRVFVTQACYLAGGVFLNIGSAVQGPEVFLKAVSMATNVGHPPLGLTTASFDLRPLSEGAEGYYCRDQKTVLKRIPEAFNGVGHYVQGFLQETIPALYKGLVDGFVERGK